TPIGDTAGDREAPLLRLDRERRGGDHVPHDVRTVDLDVGAVAVVVRELQHTRREVACFPNLGELEDERVRRLRVVYDLHDRLSRVHHMPLAVGCLQQIHRGGAAAEPDEAGEHQRSPRQPPGLAGHRPAPVDAGGESLPVHLFGYHVRIMQMYLVGGAVRDRLLGRPVKERDWVVVGASPEELEQQGFVPVGREFPIFLHPQTHEEYALARLERKVAPGYRGFTTQFSPDVTLEEDLRRRDLTINAMAETSTGELIDPYGGRRDLEARLLRHVSESFIEDPVRVLRVAR